MNIGITIIVILGSTIGALSTLYCLVSLFAVVLWKIYRRIVKGIPIFE